MTRFIKGSALVVANGGHVAIIDRNVRIDLSTGLHLSSEDMSSALWSGIEKFASLVGEEPGLIEEALARQGLLSEVQSADISWPWAIGLADAIVDSSGVDCSRIVYTADEAFVPGNDLELARFAFRIFVSSLVGIDRCMVYSRLAAGDQLAVVGDLPVPEALDRLRGQWEHVKMPTVFDLTSGQVTGEAASVAACWGGQAGRLNLTALTGKQEWDLETHRLTWVSGRTAFSNLGALPRLKTTSSSREVDYMRVSGVDVSADLAVRKCLSEGAERFAAGALRLGELRHAAATSLVGSWLHPESIFAYTPVQRHRLGLSEFDASVEEWWVEGTNRNGPVWIPAALVFYPFPVPSWLTEHAVSSNGMAAHESTEMARRHAWLELVERDALQRARFEGPISPPRQIRLDSLAGITRKIVRLLERQGAVHVLKLHSPTKIPVALVRTSTPDMLAIGMSAAVDFQDAVTKAATEALVEVVHPFTHRVSPQDVNDPADHAALYTAAEWRKKLDWMTAGPVTDIAEVEGYGTYQLGPKAAWYRLPNTPEGLHVVRVVDPDLIPITFGWDSDPAGRADMFDLVRAAGLAADSPLDPHPFA